MALTLTYTVRGNAIRFISLRKASRKEKETLLMGKIVKMTSEEIKAMRAAGGDMTDWERVRNLTEEEVERMAMEDPDNFLKTDEDLARIWVRHALKHRREFEPCGDCNRRKQGADRNSSHSKVHIAVNFMGHNHGNGCCWSGQKNQPRQIILGG